MKILILLFTFIFGTIITSAEDYERIKIQVKTNTGEKFEDLYFGVHPDATFHIDYELGEKEKPPFPPPGGLYCSFKWNDTLDVDNIERINSNEVYFPIPNNESDKYHYKYNLFIRKDNSYDTATVSWEINSLKIDSAYFTDIGEILFNVDMFEQSSHKIIGSAIFVDNYVFNVYFDKDEVSVNDDFIFNNIRLYPNPAVDILNLSEYFDDVNIYAPTGRLVSTHTKTDHVNISELSSGIYIINLKNGDNTITKKFIKF